MKKIILVLLLVVGFCFNSKAGHNLDSTALITYQIDTTGLSNGLIIPDPFYITITGFDLNREGSFYFVASSQTYTDTLDVVNIKNDDFSYSKRFYVQQSDLTTMTILQLFNATVKQALQDIYGANNVSVLP